MSALLLFIVALVWIAVAMFASVICARQLGSPIWRFLLATLIFASLLPLPLLDEIFGKRQFASLCIENSSIQVDRLRASGKTVYLARNPDVSINGTSVRIVLKPWRFIDVATGEVVVSYNTLTAGGGYLVRALGISEGGVPLTFKGFCTPEEAKDSVKLLKQLNVTQVQRASLREK